MLWMIILAQVSPQIPDLKIGLTIKYFSPARGSVMTEHTKRKFKRNTESMPFLVTCRAWRALCEDKEKKEKVSLLKGKEK